MVGAGGPLVGMLGHGKVATQLILRVIPGASLHGDVLLVSRQSQLVVSRTAIGLSRCVSEHILGAKLLLDGRVNLVNRLLLRDLQEPPTGLPGDLGEDLLPILFRLFADPTMRSSQLLRDIPGISQKMLTQHLRELEQDGIVHRKVYPEVPPKVEYSLTSFGETLRPIMGLLNEWGQKHMKRIEER